MVFPEIDDIAVRYSSNLSERGIYIYAVGGWQKLVNPTEDQLNKTWPDVLKATLSEADGGFPGGPYGVVADYIGSNSNYAEIIANHAEIKTSIVSNTPRYYGKYQDTTPSGLFVTGDTYCRYSTTSGTTNRGIFRWDGDSWERTEAVADVTKALTDVSFLIAYTNTSGTAIYGTAADYSGDSTVQANFAFFQSAMIGYLEAENIKIRANGSIRGGDRYDESGTTIDGTKPGFYIAASGACKVAGIEFEGSLNGGVQWSSPTLVTDISYTYAGTDQLGLATIGGNTILVANPSTNEINAYSYAGVISSETTLGFSDMSDPAICSLASNRAAFINGYLDKLYTITWDGTSLGLIGSGTTVSGLSGTTNYMTTLNSTDVVIGTDSKLLVYRWNPSTSGWGFIANQAIAASFNTGGGLTTLYENKIAVTASGSLWYAEWNGVSFSMIGNAYTFDTVPTGQCITAVNATDVVFTSQGTSLRIYRFNGTDWVLNSDFGEKANAASVLSLAALSGTDVVYHDSYIAKIKILRFGYSISQTYIRQLTD